MEKDELPNSNFYLHEGLIKTKSDSKIFVPASLEGTVLVYCHFITGHTGWVQLYSYVRQKFFFPDLKEKVAYQLGNTSSRTITEVKQR